MLKVVLFTGGRGSGVLSSRLLADRQIDLVLAINGYDDGASTGEVRRFLGDALGPSDYRKNASRVAAAKKSCSPELIRLLDARLRVDITPTEAVDELTRFMEGRGTGPLAAELSLQERRLVAERLEAFLSEWRASGKPFEFGDCAVGNLVFAGAFLLQGRRFNAALDDYTAMVGLPAGLIENVTDGVNAHLVAVDAEGQVLGTEESLVTLPRQSGIVDLFLLSQPLAPAECEALGRLGLDSVRRTLESRAVRVKMNERLARKIDEADVIIYAPGTQHSSLYPSYLTEGLSERIAGNLHAQKLLITNLEPDVEIQHENAVSLVQRALYYLSDKGRSPILAPCLVTHYLMNDPMESAPDRPLVPLGQVETFEDSRLVRIGNFEDGVTGRHDAVKILEPFIRSRIERPAPVRIAVLLYGQSSTTVLVQTLLEIARVHRPTEVELTVYVGHPEPLPAELLSRLPFEVRPYASEAEAEWWLRMAVDAHECDFVALFESSGVYRGEDLTGLFQYLSQTRLAAVWGSRRLSIRDIREAYRTRHYRSRAVRMASRIGSHVLSLGYLILYGRYITDSLSGVRVLRATEVTAISASLTHPSLNQFLLASLLRRRADVLEVPVQFLPRPRQSQGLTFATGMATLLIMLSQKFARISESAPWDL